MYSKIILVGNLGADPEKKEISGGKVMAKLRLATKAATKEGETSWWYVAAFRWSADYALQYLKKGDQVLIEGAVTMRDYTDKDGNKRQAVDIVADRIQSVGKRQERTEQADSNGEEIPF